MRRHRVVLLEDDEARILAFENAIQTIGCDCFSFKAVRGFISFFEANSPRISLISLDYDLSSTTGGLFDPGRGTDVADYLSEKPPHCPVIVHTSDYGGRWAMHDRLQSAGWVVRVVEPAGPASLWIPAGWSSAAGLLLANTQ